MSPPEKPDFGPSGYLPERASKRARKIILRAPLGMQWIVGAVFAGVLVLVAGVLFLQRSGEPPPAPWTAIGAVEELGASDVVEVVSPTGVTGGMPAGTTGTTTDVLVVTAGGRIRAFADAADVDYCAESNRLEASDGRSWSLIGRGFGGTRSLDEHPTLVQDGRLYVDPTRMTPGAEPSSRTVRPACV